MKLFKNIVHILDNKGLKKLFVKSFYKFFLVIVIPLLILSYVFGFFLVQTNEKQMIAMNETILKRTTDACDAQLKEVEFYVVNASLENDITEFILMGGYQDNIEDVKKYLKFFKTINSYIDSVYVYNIDTEELITDSMHIHNSEFLNEMGLSVSEISDYNRTLIKYSSKNNFYPYLVQMIKPIKIGNKTGLIITEVRLYQFQEILKSLQNESENKILILDKNDDIVYSDVPSDEYMVNFSEYMEANTNKSNIISRAKSAYYELTYVSVMKNSTFIYIQRMYMWFFVLAFVVVCIIGLCISYYITKKSINPIVEIIRAIKYNNFTYEGNKEIPLELQYIIDDILNSAEIKRQNAISLLSIRMFMFKLLNTQALEAQINPHFLYNTLDSINWIAFSELGKNNRISSSLNDLSKLFKFALSIDSYVITLEEELAHIRIYERLLKRQYGDNLKIHYNISSDCLKYHCVKFALQPIVENAINHGIKPNSGVGNIYISALSDKDYWYIEIKDDGVGIDCEKIDEMNKVFSEVEDYEKEFESIVELYQSNDAAVTENTYPKHLGMKNINQRIHLIYGNSCGIKVQLNEMGGTTVIIKQKNKQ